ncbi:hypothetical protein EN956_15395, partial [Mesorhizobium sp. M7A.F.Ca.CA.004.05.2.1]
MKMRKRCCHGPWAFFRIFQQKTLPQIIELFAPGSSLVSGQSSRAGVLADRHYQEQCCTDPAAHGSRMNFPQMPANPEIPACKLNGPENAGKILLEWISCGFQGTSSGRPAPAAAFRWQSALYTIENGGQPLYQPREVGKCIMGNFEASVFNFAKQDPPHETCRRQRARKLTRLSPLRQQFTPSRINNYFSVLCFFFPPVLGSVVSFVFA